MWIRYSLALPLHPKLQHNLSEKKIILQLLSLIRSVCHVQLQDGTRTHAAFQSSEREKTIFHPVMSCFAASDAQQEMTRRDQSEPEGEDLRVYQS